MPSFPPRGLVADFCEQVVAHDLPALPADRRDAAVAFATRRIAGLPSPMKVAVGAVATVVGGLSRAAGSRRVAGVLAGHPLPIGGEYVRLVRSLTYAFIWETWPDTSASGAPLDGIRVSEAAPAHAGSGGIRVSGAAAGAPGDTRVPVATGSPATAVDPSV